MKAYLILILILSNCSYAQNKIESYLDQEYQLGHFNGAALVIKDRKVISRMNKGFANFQFKVPIDNTTRFPIASATKLFTTIALLQLQERSLIKFDDKISKYISELPENCQHIAIADLLLHYSGLSNEPIKAYLSKYNLDSYIKTFVALKKTTDTIRFNYNNVDYVLLSKIIEKATGKSFSEAIKAQILTPLKMKNTGFVEESDIIPNLAYGYHNYSFGSGKPGDTLYNDQRFISNYFGAGQLYSTTEDLYKLITALKNDQLISKQSRLEYVVKPQKNIYIDWLEGAPTYGFYFDDKSHNGPALKRMGNIDGFNAEIMVDKDFTRVIILLSNTDTGDLPKMCNKIFSLIN